MILDNRVEIKIGGQSYTLNTTEDEEYVCAMAQEIDARVNELRARGSGLSLNDALVLCIMGYCDSYKKERANTDNMRAQLKEYLDEAGKYRCEAEEAKRTAQRLQKELDKLKAKKAKE